MGFAKCNISSSTLSSVHLNLLLESSCVAANGDSAVFHTTWTPIMTSHICSAFNLQQTSLHKIGRRATWKQQHRATFLQATFQHTRGNLVAATKLPHVWRTLSHSTSFGSS